MDSLHRIALTTITIILISAFLYVFWQTTSLVGRPLGKLPTNLAINLAIKLPPEGDSDDDANNTNKIENNDLTPKISKERSRKAQQKQKTLEFTRSITAATLGLFVFMVLFPLALEDSAKTMHATTHQWYAGGVSERFVSVGLVVSWVAVKCWGETMAVLAVLAGVVKGLGLDADAGVGFDAEEKDVKRSA